MTNGRWQDRVNNHPDLIEPTRQLLIETGKPYIIENVVNAPLINPTMLCGTMFGLRTRDGYGELQRHRLFDSNCVFGLTPQCQHAGPVIGVYGGHVRDRRRAITVTGKGEGYNANKGRLSFTNAQAQEAMGIDWMNQYELSQSFPPAYTEWIGKQIIKQLTTLTGR